jgi:hypothetical protein
LESQLRYVFLQELYLWKISSNEPEFFLIISAHLCFAFSRLWWPSYDRVFFNLKTGSAAGQDSLCSFSGLQRSFFILIYFITVQLRRSQLGKSCGSWYKSLPRIWTKPFRGWE